MQRAKAYLIIGVSYALACAAAWLVFLAALPDGFSLFNIILAFFAADAAATAVIWLFGLIFKNSSFYDAYWSLIPWLIVLAAMIKFSLFNINNVVFLAVFGVWSFRLTGNWAYTCISLKTEDWRYTNYRNTLKPLMWHIVNFFGIHFFPTIIVFLGLVPALIFLFNSSESFSFSIILGCAVILAGTLLEYFADGAMHKFRKNSADKTAVLDIGLWKFSRHPNYLGEITVWLGVYLTLLLTAPRYYWCFFGVAAMVCLFLFVSIPLAEKRQLARRPAYAQYKKRTSMLLLLPPRKIDG